MEDRAKTPSWKGPAARETRKAAAIAARAAMATEPAPPSSFARTRATYRGLMMRGLALSEAATLTGYLAGIPVGQVWTLREVNQLLFLRELDRRGQWVTGGSARPDRPTI